MPILYSWLVSKICYIIGINGPDFSLKEGTLNPEKDYKIVLTVGKENYITPYNLTIVLNTSKTGQDIFNGFCNATFIPGKPNNLNFLLCDIVIFI